MTTNELCDHLSRGMDDCAVYLGANYEDAKPVTEALLELGFVHGGSEWSQRVCKGDLGSFHWHYASIEGCKIEYHNYGDDIEVLTLDDLLHPASSAPDPTPEEIEAFYLEAIGVMS